MIRMALEVLRNQPYDRRTSRTLTFISEQYTCILLHHYYKYLELTYDIICSKDIRNLVQQLQVWLFLPDLGKNKTKQNKEKEATLDFAFII